MYMYSTYLDFALDSALPCKMKMYNDFTVHVYNTHEHPCTKYSVLYMCSVHNMYGKVNNNTEIYGNSWKDGILATPIIPTTL